MVYKNIVVKENLPLNLEQTLVLESLFFHYQDLKRTLLNLTRLDIQTYNYIKLPEL